MASVAIVSAIIGGRDEPHPQAEQDVEVDWVLFSDEDMDAPAPWNLEVEPPAFKDPNMAAKVHKMTPKLSHRYVIWVDGSMEVTSSSFAREALEALHDGMAVWKHPRRDCVYAEAEASLGAESQGGRYDHLPIKAQMSSYLIEGHPAHYGLYACGTVAWDRKWSHGLGAAWLAEVERWGIQDQLALPPVLRRHEVIPGIFRHDQITRSRGGVLANPWLVIHPHS